MVTSLLTKLAFIKLMDMNSLKREGLRDHGM